MLRSSLSRHAALAAIGLALFGAPAMPASAGDFIAPGYDLFETGPGTSFRLDLPVEVAGAPGLSPSVTFTGVPLGSYRFPEFGEIPTRETDTIVRRLTGGGLGSPIPIELLALQMRSVDAPVDLYVTLNPVLPSMGTIVPTSFDSSGGSFQAQLTVNYDVRLLSLDGPVVLSNTVTFAADSLFGRAPDIPRELTKAAENHVHTVRPIDLDFPPLNSDFFPGTPLDGGQDLSIAPGYDLFVTAPGTSFGLDPSDLLTTSGPLPGVVALSPTIEFAGEPLGAYVLPDGTTIVTEADTIVRRTKAGGVGTPIPIELVALQLRSTNTPMPFYATLTPGRPSTGMIVPTSTGTAGGSFQAQLTVNYDVRLGSSDGPVLLSDTVTFTATSLFGRTNDIRRQLAKVANYHRHFVRPIDPPFPGLNEGFFPGNPVA